MDLEYYQLRIHITDRILYTLIKFGEHGILSFEELCKILGATIKDENLNEAVIAECIAGLKGLGLFRIRHEGESVLMGVSLRNNLTDEEMGEYITRWQREGRTPYSAKIITHN